MGLAVVVCFGLLVYSHNSLSHHIIDTNNSMIDTCNNLKDVNIHTNERITRISQQLNSNDLHYNQMYSNMNNKVNLVDQRTINLENTVQEVSTNLVNVGKLGNSNVLKLSQESLQLSQKASQALNDIAEASSTVEATTIGLAKMWEIVSEYTTRIETIESKVGIGIQNTITSPRINPLNIVQPRNNNDI